MVTPTTTPPKSSSTMDEDPISPTSKQSTSSSSFDPSIRNEIKQGNIRNLLTEQEALTNSVDDAKISNLRDKSYVIDSNEAIHLKLIKSEQDLKDEDTTFYPNYTYQLFGEDEQIIGYKNLKVELYYVASTLYTFLRMSFDQKLGSPDCDPIAVLTKKKIEWDDKSALPIPEKSYTVHLEEFVSHINDPFTPPGEQVTGYMHNSASFEVYKGTFSNAQVAKYHERLQTFCLFFIDGANYIDSHDPKWEVFFLFEKYKNSENQTKYSIVGYTTVYHFYAYPESTRLRISQFLVLPPYQKQGHGSKLLNAVYTSAQSSNVLEVCLEDPSEQFQSMRDVVDYKNFHDRYKNELPEHWSEEFADSARKELKINKVQLRKCYETAMLEKLKFSEVKDDSLLTNFRLDVKRRLYKSYDMDKFALDADERKKQLQELYTQIEEQYLDVIQKCGHQ